MGTTCRLAPDRDAYNGGVADPRIVVLASGSAGNAVWLEAGGTAVLVDAGLSGEALLRRMARAGCSLQALAAVLLTHEHDDHARGAAALARAVGAPVLANEATLRACGLDSSAPCERIANLQPFRVGAWTVEAVPVPHDAADPVAFVLEAAGTRVAVATDLGDVGQALVERAFGCDVVLLEANYDLRLLGVSPYPWFVKNRIVGRYGHLSNDGAAAAAVRLHAGRPQRFVLLHVSEVNNLAPLARDVVAGALERHGVAAEVQVVRPNEGSEVPLAGRR
ncbi:MAG: MBL fold metallo-hydrolase [Armatimonadota bacterium]|nr:MBL fold metallo-hydrolase [Armatimonadota bacterium]MDR5689773.1 MBL fold metallo-hydrolase [Armatimonadota bacterium]MDR7412700.1 MBL fold metallo-hydrolase [Armatimonadota bacterium]MDR7540635.1 MBL fold metallo-hydrolase [Armatimonadota bacterium]MDR7577389.1 MBL fold metallo-hydrolase [Armatimonadota bacterium]